eukprot:jgi/Tetstr1/423463/TSEL_014144.t1
MTGLPSGADNAILVAMRFGDLVAQQHHAMDEESRSRTVLNLIRILSPKIGVQVLPEDVRVAEMRVGEAEMRHRHGKMWPCDSHQRHPKAPDGLTWLRVSA